VQNKTTGPAQEFTHHDYKWNIGLIMSYSKDFCATGNRLRISATVKLHLCLFSEHGLDVRQFLLDNSERRLQDELLSLLADKKLTHFLHDGYKSATKHLAMLSGK
jgi:cyclic pyranopterin phosphate synthase